MLVANSPEKVNDITLKQALAKIAILASCNIAIQVPIDKLVQLNMVASVENKPNTQTVLDKLAEFEVVHLLSPANDVVLTELGKKTYECLSYKHEVKRLTKTTFTFEEYVKCAKLFLQEGLNVEEPCVEATHSSNESSSFISS